MAFLPANGYDRKRTIWEDKMADRVAKYENFSIQRLWVDGEIVPEVMGLSFCERRSFWGKKVYGDLRFVVFDKMPSLISDAKKHSIVIVLIKEESEDCVAGMFLDCEVTSYNGGMSVDDIAYEMTVHFKARKLVWDNTPGVKNG
jgi:hypothetical protein